MSFKSVQKKIAAQGHSMGSAGAILAESSRNASPAAKKANPKLTKVPKKGQAPPWLQAAAKNKLASMTEAPKGKKKANPFAKG